MPLGLQHDIERLMSQLDVGHEHAPQPRTLSASHEFDSVSIETIVAWMGAAESGDVSAREHLQRLKDRYSVGKNQVCVPNHHMYTVYSSNKSHRDLCRKILHNHL